MNESILKEEKGKVNLSQSIELCNIIKIDNILNHDFEKSTLKINGFSIEKKERYYFISKGRFFKDDNLFSLYDKTKEYDRILLKYKNTFLKLKDNKELITSDINQLVSYLYYDLLINLEIASYKHNLDINNDEEKKYIHKILGKKLDYSKKNKKSNQKEYKKSTLIQRATNAKYWNRRYHSKGLLSSIASVSERINPIELEFPLKYENEKVFLLLKDFSDVLDLLKIENRDFQIRFKKLGHYKKEGMYLKSSKTLVVDPRYSKTIFHELGHFIYETDTGFYFKGVKITKRGRNKITKKYKDKYKNKIKNHKTEELDENSETFSYWLEDIVRNDILNKEKTNIKSVI